MEDKRTAFVRYLRKAWKAKKIHFDARTGRTWPNAQLSARARFTREYVFKQFWQSFVDDRFDLDNAIQTKAEFSHAIAVMDNIEGWDKESWVGSRFAASMWIHKGCNMQRSRQHARVQPPMPWTTTCGSLNSPSLVRKQKFWELCHTTLQAHAWSSGVCCGSRHQQVSVGDI